ncbi:hypothetical protein [Piscinibacter gummiphilus]|uniref:Uncharacterized protein n=1 Tax=Piscinibacter gummiphilus TaxID=946333 RepID=A0ABZ0CNQ3_9BURK|nr:hypothetical protein [Piscinibacter gummiphilus]WOB06473.1 hypothetical protein RXV79_16245 [Piscinibacter gummiphilus]
MKTTDEQLQNDQAAYADAFNEDAPVAAEPSEDEAFGITADAPADEAAEGEGAAPAEAAAEPAVDPEVGSETQGEGGAGEPAAPADEPREDGASTVTEEPESMTAEQIAKETQRLKSWEGRLKAMERQLAGGAKPAAEPAAEEAAPVAEDAAADESAADEPDADAVDAAEAAGAPDVAEAAAEVSELAEQVESGEITPEQAKARLAEDFGEDFVNFIEMIAGAKASKAAEDSVSSKVGELSGAVDEIIAHISDRDAQAHFEKVHSAHPDFNDVAASQGFATYVAGLPEAEKAEAERITKTGSADEVIKLIAAYKASGEDETPNADAPAADPVASDDQLDAAEGVRSSGMRLPEAPKPGAKSFEEAWDEFA